MSLKHLISFSIFLLKSEVYIYTTGHHIMGSTSEAELVTAHSQNPSCRLGRDQDVLPINQANHVKFNYF